MSEHQHHHDISLSFSLFTPLQNKCPPTWRLLHCTVVCVCMCVRVCVYNERQLRLQCRGCRS